MYYRLYSYTITQNNNIPVGPDRHYDLFVKSKGKDEFGALAVYRGRKNSILMHLQKYQSDFSGLIGKYSTERQVTKYDDVEDTADTITVDDEDYPNTPFIAYPRLGFIAVLDSGQLKADGAISRLHNIIGHRTKSYFVAEAVTQPIDLRKAVKRFKVTEVTFEIFPVNPHTGDLGKKLDDDRARDHIKKIYGKLDGSVATPLELNGGLLTQIQQLQQSGHSKVGFKATSNGGAEIQIPKPRDRRELAENEEELVVGEEAHLRIEFKNARLTYPFHQGHITDLRTIIRDLTEEKND